MPDYKGRVVKKLVFVLLLLAAPVYGQVWGPCALCLKTTGGTMTGTISFSGSGMLASATPIAIGSGTATGTLGGTYAKFSSGTGVGNGADTTDDPLWTLTSIPANTFTSNGDALILTLHFHAGATGNNKRVGVTVSSTQVNTGTLTYNNIPFIATIMIVRVDSTHVNVLLAITGNTATSNDSLNLAVSDLTANTLALVVTGASQTTGAANDVKLYSGLAEFKK